MCPPVKAYRFFTSVHVSSIQSSLHSVLTCFCFLSHYCLVWCFLNSSALVTVHPDVKNWIKYARFEEKHGYFAHARKVYERAVAFFGDEHMDEHLYVAFAKFEENQKEVSI